MKSIPVNIGDAVKCMTMTVHISMTGIRWFKLRLWIGSRLIKLAASIIGCGIEIKTGENQ